MRLTARAGVACLFLAAVSAPAFVARGEERKADPNDEAVRVLAEKVERNESAQELMTPHVKAMVEKALAYLKTTQASDGSWSDGADFKSNTGVTALASMAFMPEGRALAFCLISLELGANHGRET